ncbi:MAG: allophanate hydrolase subunit 1 [Lachnospiraceae bacterium]|jgi:KipI family sensor histidine kinase inhibitor|nr:allophanate hydrolase subunit 1 [Lachnospiraceae bacterium]
MDGSVSATMRPCGDSALTVEFENEISLGTNMKVQALAGRLEKENKRGVGELIPAYRSLFIEYDPLALTYGEMKDWVGAHLEGLDATSKGPRAVTEIPVLYAGEDLEEISAIEGKPVDEIIRIHSGSDYFVYMLGFSPGHPYTARFENPFSFGRRATPRVEIPAGSVVVQLGMSNIIPFDQPCGWNIIGRTPVRVCDFSRERPFLLRSGQWVRYVPVDPEEFRRIRELDARGGYICKEYLLGP